MKYDLKLENYEGPIEKLLELIEAREMDVTEISMALVTDDFLKYLENLSADYKSSEASGNAAAEGYMRLLSDFIVIGSRLVFIKSKALIPDIKLNEEEEAGIKDLEDRLLLYQKLKPVMRVIATRWRKGASEYAREYFLHVKGLLLAIRANEGKGTEFFYPGGNLDAKQLNDALRKILALTEQVVAEEKVIQEKIVSLEEKIKEIISNMRNINEATFRGIAKGASRGEAIVAFLAILHLAREQLVMLEQESSHSDIIIRKRAD
jgi:segregation and condensation protein A